MKLIRFESVPEWFGYVTNHVGIYNNQSILPYQYSNHLYISVYNSPILYQRVYDYNHRSLFKRWLDFINPFR